MTELSHFKFLTHGVAFVKNYLATHSDHLKYDFVGMTQKNGAISDSQNKRSFRAEDMLQMGEALMTLVFGIIPVRAIPGYPGSSYWISRMNQTDASVLNPRRLWPYDPMHYEDVIPAGGTAWDGVIDPSWEFYAAGGTIPLDWPLWMRTGRITPGWLWLFASTIHEFHLNNNSLPSSHFVPLDMRSFYLQNAPNYPSPTMSLVRTIQEDRRITYHYPTPGPNVDDYISTSQTTETTREDYNPSYDPYADMVAMASSLRNTHRANNDAMALNYKGNSNLYAAIWRLHNTAPKWSDYTAAIQDIESFQYQYVSLSETDSPEPGVAGFYVAADDVYVRYRLTHEPSSSGTDIDARRRLFVGGATVKPTLGNSGICFTHVYGINGPGWLYDDYLLTDNGSWSDNVYHYFEGKPSEGFSASFNGPGGLPSRHSISKVETYERYTFSLSDGKSSGTVRFVIPLSKVGAGRSFITPVSVTLFVSYILTTEFDIDATNRNEYDGRICTAKWKDRQGEEFKEITWVSQFFGDRDSNGQRRFGTSLHKYGIVPITHNFVGYSATTNENDLKNPHVAMQDNDAYMVFAVDLESLSQTQENIFSSLPFSIPGSAVDMDRGSKSGSKSFGFQQSSSTLGMLLRFSTTIP